MARTARNSSTSQAELPPEHSAVRELLEHMIDVLVEMGCAPSGLSLEFSRICREKQARPGRSDPPSAPLIRLTVSLLQRHVRTETICEWTGLTRAHVKRIRKSHEHEFPAITLRRPTGPSPRKLRQFLRSARMRNEAAAAAGLCRAYNVIPAEPVPDAHRYLPSVPRGEHLIRVYDLFWSLVPSATLSLEQLMFLLMSLATGETHDLGECVGCQGTILIDPAGAARKLCMHCVGELNALARGPEPQSDF